jgi:hypothetical protein
MGTAKLIPNKFNRAKTAAGFLCPSPPHGNSEAKLIYELKLPANFKLLPAINPTPLKLSVAFLIPSEAPKNRSFIFFYPKLVPSWDKKPKLLFFKLWIVAFRS